MEVEHGGLGTRYKATKGIYVTAWYSSLRKVGNAIKRGNYLKIS